MPVCRSDRLQRDTTRLKFVMLTEHNARKWTELVEGLVACVLALVSSHCEPVWPSGKALVSRGTSVRFRFGSPFSSKRLWFVDAVL